MKKVLMTLLASIFAGSTAFSQSKNITSQDNHDFANTIADTTVQLIDVRTPAEFSSGHIPRAVNMDVNSSDFESLTASLNKEYPVAIYCRSGARSKNAAQKLAQAGFKIYELDKGFMNWNGEKTK